MTKACCLDWWLSIAFFLGLIVVGFYFFASEAINIIVALLTIAVMIGLVQLVGHYIFPKLYKKNMNTLKQTLGFHALY